MEVVNKNITKNEIKEVERLVRKCMRHLKKKEYELNIPNGAIDNAVHILKIKKRKHTPCRAGAHTIEINLGYWQIKNDVHMEYANFADDPIIGNIKVNNFSEHLMIMVAHEVSHHVQYKYAPKVKRFKDNYRKPHGDCFKMIYRYLRRDLINNMVMK